MTYEHMSEAWRFVRDELNLDLPVDWDKLQREDFKPLIDLGCRPSWWLWHFDDCVRYLTETGKQKLYASQIHDKILEIVNARQNRFKNEVCWEDDGDDDGFATYYCTVKAPNGTNLNFYTFNGRLFVRVLDVVKAFGHREESFSLSPTDFSKSVSVAGAKYYRFHPSDDTYLYQFFDLDDVPKILHEFAFNMTLNREYAENAQKLLDFLKTNMPKLPTVAKKDFDTPSNHLDAIATYTRVPKAALIDFIINQRRELNERELADLKEILQ